MAIETVTGTDVSFNQKIVNWLLARTRDRVRLGFIRWTQVPWKDSKRLVNWNAAKEAGQLRGVYVLYVPEESGLYQANFFIEDFEQLVGSYDGELPIAVDVELEPVDWDELRIMCERLSAWAGRDVIIYSGAWFLKRVLPLPDWFTALDFWLTGYGNTDGPDLVPGYDLAVYFWQRTSSWAVPWVRWPNGGIVDRTDWMGTYEELRRYSNVGELVVKVSDIEQMVEDKAFEIPEGPVVPPIPPEPPGGDFKLVWPTPNPKVVTQWYGINPQWYNPFGLPGHEGLDMRAFQGVEIYAAAVGQVIRVQSSDNNNYGIHVRIEHVHPSGTYKTVYAHLIDAVVSVGDQVSAGQLIGHANDTGNSNGSHLHLTMKKVGDGSPWMGVSDIINPVPYLPDLWPRCTIPGYTGTGWRTDVGGNFRTSPEINDNLIRWIPAGNRLVVSDFGGEGGDWWKATFEGQVGWFWNSGYKLSAL